MDFNRKAERREIGMKYDAVVEIAKAEYYRATAPAQRAYNAAILPAQEVRAAALHTPLMVELYETVNHHHPNPPNNPYVVAERLIWVKYDEAIAPAKRALQEAIAPAVQVFRDAWTLAQTNRDREIRESLAKEHIVRDSTPITMRVHEDGTLGFERTKATE